jgi:hypothetical protein
MTPSDYLYAAKIQQLNPVERFVASTQVVLNTKYGLDYVFASPRERTKMEARSLKKITEQPTEATFELATDSMASKIVTSAILGAGYEAVSGATAGIPVFTAISKAGAVAFFVAPTAVTLGSDIVEGNATNLAKDVITTGVELAAFSAGSNIATSKEVANAYKALKSKIYTTTEYTINVPIEKTVGYKNTPILKSMNNLPDSGINFKTDIPGITIKQHGFVPETITSISTGKTTGRVQINPLEPSEASVLSATELLDIGTSGGKGSITQKNFVTILPKIKTTEIPKINFMEGVEAPKYPKTTVSSGRGGIFKMYKGRITAYDLLTATSKTTTGKRLGNIGKIEDIPVSFYSGHETSMASSRRIYSTNVKKAPMTERVTLSFKKFGEVIPDKAMKAIHNGKLTAIDLLSMRSGPTSSRVVNIIPRKPGFRYSPPKMESKPVFGDIKSNSDISFMGEGKTSSGGGNQEISLVKTTKRMEAPSEISLVDSVIAGMESGKKAISKVRSKATPYRNMPSYGAIALLSGRNSVNEPFAFVNQRQSYAQKQTSVSRGNFNPVSLLTGQTTTPTTKSSARTNTGLRFETLLGLQYKQKNDFVPKPITVQKPQPIEQFFGVTPPPGGNSRVNKTGKGVPFFPNMGGELGDGFTFGKKTRQTSRKRRLINLFV